MNKLFAMTGCSATSVKSNVSITHSAHEKGATGGDKGQETWAAGALAMAMASGRLMISLEGGVRGHLGESVTSFHYETEDVVGGAEPEPVEHLDEEGVTGGGGGGG